MCVCCSPCFRCRTSGFQNDFHLYCLHWSVHVALFLNRIWQACCHDTRARSLHGRSRLSCHLFSRHHGYVCRMSFRDTMSVLRCFSNCDLHNKRCRSVDVRSRSSCVSDSVRIFRSASSLPASTADDRNTKLHNMCGTASREVCS